MFDEQTYLPFSAGTLPQGAWLVIAPHPDDEAFGLGGALLLAAQQGIAADVLFLTSGGKGGAEGIAAVREQEALEAARLMGIREVFFWRLPDRSLSAYQSVIDRLAEVIGSTKPSTIFFPSPVEPHPDHRAASVIAWEALRKTGFTAEPWSYEISVQGPVNHLLDISQVVAHKREIMAVYASQMTQNSYMDSIIGLNQGRAWSLPLDVSHAEAFFIWPKQDRSLNAMLMVFQTPKLGMDAVPDIAATVSVIIRTKNRPHFLREAIVSVATQTYRDIEIVVVNDGGEDVEELVREYATGSIQRLVYEALQPGRGRAAAANAGLDIATGKYLIFLDDDDIFYPDHIASLAEVLRRSGEARCAYAGVRVEYYKQGQLERTIAFNEPFDLAKLWGRNFIPIHAVLFDRSLHQQGCRFDEMFEILEDWDFWLQLSQRTQFVHLDQISACYRNFGESGLGSHINEDLLRQATGSVFEKWKTIWTGRQWADIVLCRDAMLEQGGQWAVSLQTILAERESELELIRNQLSERGAELVRNHQMLCEREAQLKYQERMFRILQNQINEQQESELENKKQSLVWFENRLAEREAQVSNSDAKSIVLQQTIELLYQSTSWRITWPLRYCSSTLKHHYSRVVTGTRRLIRLVGRLVFKCLPRQWRGSLVDYSYRVAGPLFAGFNDYERWRRSGAGSLDNSAPDASNLVLDFGVAPPADRYLAWRQLNRAHGNRIRSISNSCGCILFPRRPHDDVRAFFELIGGFERISFDVFDTLIERVTTQPTDVFHIVGHAAPDCFKTPWNFAQARIDAELEARAKNGESEVTLDEIYDRLVVNYPLTPLEADRLKAIEITTELALLKPKASGKRLYVLALARGINISLISDTYLPRDMLERALGQTGYNSGWDHRNFSLIAGNT